MNLFDDFLTAADPLRTARRAGIVPDEWQERFLSSDALQVLLNCSRQSGKSTASGVLAAHDSMRLPERLALLIAPTERQSGELLRKARDVLVANGARIRQESALRMELANGSRIIALPGSEATVRTYSPDLVLIDEAARIRDELYGALRPMLAVSRGRIVMLSTPWGRRGVFYHEWTEGGDDWLRIRVPATECPRIDPEWLEAERARTPEFIFRQEFMCEFTETNDQIFTHDLVRSAIDDGIIPLFRRTA